MPFEANWPTRIDKRDGTPAKAIAIHRNLFYAWPVRKEWLNGMRIVDKCNQ